MAKAKGLLEALDLWWHGSDNAFRTFDPKKLGSGEGGRDASYGFYFGKSPKTAKSYLYEDTSINPKVFQEVFGYSLEDANKFKEQALLDYLAKHPNLTREQALDFSSNQPKESIYSFGNRDPDAMRYKSIETKTTPSAYEYGAPRDVYMRGIPSSKMIDRKREGYLMGAEIPPMEDMKIVDMSGEAWDEGKQALIARMARDEGYSGVVFQNMVDDAFSGSGADDIALVFDPSDINTRQVKAINAPDIEFDKLKSGIAPTAAAGLLGAMALTQSEDAEAGKFSIDDLKYLYKQAKDGNEGALKWLMDDSGLDATDTLRRVENKIAKADRVTPTGDLTPVPTPEPDFSYRGSHRAPDADYGAPLYDLTEILDDIYGPKGQYYHGYGDPAVDREVFESVRKARGNPDLEVPIYRAVPEGVDRINTGDWVTTSREYARRHGENALGGKYSILEDVAPAKKLQSEGYPYEFGLLPALSAMAIGLGTSEDADAAALEAGMPMAMQAGGQSAMDAKPDLGRDAGTLIGLLDFLLPFAAEFAKPATMGNAELTEEQRRQRKYYGQ